MGAQKKPANLSLSASLLDEARELGLNLAAVPASILEGAPVPLIDQSDAIINALDIVLTGV